MPPRTLHPPQPVTKPSEEQSLMGNATVAEDPSTAELKVRDSYTYTDTHTHTHTHIIIQNIMYYFFNECVGVLLNWKTVLFCGALNCSGWEVLM